LQLPKAGDQKNEYRNNQILEDRDLSGRCFWIVA